MRRHARGIVIGVLGAALIAAVFLTPLLLVHRTDLPLERAYGNAMVSLVSGVFGGDAKNPVAGNARATTAGRYEYTGSCASCHGATGDGRGVFGQATYPLATDLTSADAKARSDAQLFWITKNGLSFTAMPGFARQYTDQEIWSIVTYVRQLQEGGAGALNVPPPTESQLTVANPFSAAPAARGAAVYFAQGCQYCHGAVGNAPGELSLHESESDAIRRGRPGMPAYGAGSISATQLSDLVAYLRTFPGERGRD